MHRQFDIFVGEAPDVLAVHWGWLIALGVGLVVLGFIAIWRARAATLISVGFLGVLLLVSAVAVLAFAFSLAGYWTDFFIHVLWAVLLGIIGLILVTRPAISAEAITLVIAFYFISTGLLGIGFALSSHIESVWLYVFDGLVSAVLAHRGRMALRARRTRELGPWMSPSRRLALLGPLGHWAFHRNRLDPQGRFHHRAGIERPRDFGVKSGAAPRCSCGRRSRPRRPRGSSCSVSAMRSPSPKAMAK